jgi:paraquat-inducible protein B
MTEETRLASKEPALRVRHRVSIIWLIPLIAALAAGWLGWRTLSARGPSIAIAFASADGLEAGKTKIKHDGVELGVIESLEPTPDLAHVVATARMHKFAEGHLTEGTRFWIVRPRFSLGGISGLSTLISGAYVEFGPGQGAMADRFTALEEPPLVNANEPGVTFSLHAKRLGSIVSGDPVSYRGLKVGQVLGSDLSDADGSVTVRIFVRAPHDRLVREGTRFWNASGVTVTAGSDGLKIQSESLSTLLLGGIDFDVPAGAEPGEVAKSDTPFTLYDDASAASDAIYTRTVRFLLHFPEAVQNLKAGAEVRMQGMRIGQVADVHMEFDAAIDRVSVPVVIEIEADRVRLLHDTTALNGFEQRAYATFDRFVARGLRARLGSGNLIIGQKVVNLDFAPDTSELKMIVGGKYPEIPTVSSSDLDTVIASAKDLLGSLQVAVTRLNGVVSSPEVARSLRSLDGSLVNLDHITRDVRAAGVGPLIAQLRAAAGSADSALKQADATLAVAGGALDGHRSDGGDLAGALRELKTAARSVRVLADYLESHPDALLLGRSEAARR